MDKIQAQVNIYRAQAELYYAQAKVYYAQAEALWSRVPVLDEFIQTHRVQVFWTLVGLAIFGIAFMLIVSYISPSDFGDENADDGEPKPTLIASQHANDGKAHILLTATGSVAAIKLPNIISALEVYENISIRVVVSETAHKFLKNQSPEQPSLARIRFMPNVDELYVDNDEWFPTWVRGSSILHIELRRWADLMVVAPLSADSLAKLALGLADNLITSVARAWDVTGKLDAPREGQPLPYGSQRDRKGILVAPAMNTAMWEHPVTAKHLKVLEEEWNVKNGGWFEVLRPIEKDLACGDVGSGAMREWKEIVDVIVARLSLKKARGVNGRAA